MTIRVFTTTSIQGDTCEIAGPEAHHLLHVLRAAPGQRVVLFDGSGYEFTARIERIGRNTIRVVIDERLEVDRELPGSLHLAVALPKGDRQRWLIEKCVELGVSMFHPLRATRGVVEADAAVLNRYERYVVEASKQCGRNCLMQLGAVIDVTGSTVPEPPAAGAGWLAEPGAMTPLADAVADQLRGSEPPQARVLIGPEGGWTPGERELLVAAGWKAIGLGRRILRIETAAAAIAATWAAMVERARR
jgi:16S rRNA (uracil1498-N3)-methyltransferase